MDRSDIDFSRGDGDIVFIYTEATEDMADKEEPRKALLEEMEERGLVIKNAKVIGIFKDEFSLLLKEDAEIKLEGEQVYPEEK